MYMVLLLATLVAAQRLPNVDYLSFGYNIYRGNPHSTKEGGDPGFVVQRIFELTYEDHRRTQDGRYEVPDRVDISHGESCELVFGSTSIFGSNSYVHSLEDEVNFVGSLYSAKFQASVDYKQVSEQTRNLSSLFTFSRAVCEVYAARINSPLSPALSKNFIEAAQELPEDLDTDAYIDFIESIGTHAVRKIQMGARFGCQSQITQESWISLESSGVSVDMAASMSAYGLTGAVDKRTEEQRKMAQAFDQKKSETRLSAIGSRPVKGGDLDAWLELVYKDPMPLQYELIPISEIFQPRYFRDANFTRNLNRLRRNMDFALDLYCRRLVQNREIASCSAPAPDPPFPKRATSCRLCAKECGGRFPLEGGAMAMDDSWTRSWTSWAVDYDLGCGGDYGNHDIYIKGVHLCCGPEDSRHVGSCRVCSKCGGEYSEMVGAEEVDWTSWPQFTQAYDEDCQGEIRFRLHPEKGGFPICCKKDPVCSMCSSCGGKWREEVGTIGAGVNWPDFFVGRGRACEGNVTKTDVRDGLKLCCINREQISHL